MCFKRGKEASYGLQCLSMLFSGFFYVKTAFDGTCVLRLEKVNGIDASESFVLSERGGFISGRRAQHRISQDRRTDHREHISRREATRSLWEC